MQNETNEKLIFTPEFIPWRGKIKKEFDLNDIETLLYGFVRFYLESASPDNNKFYFTNKQLSEMLNTSEPTITRSVKNLAKKKIINTCYLQGAGGGRIRCLSLKFQQKLLQIPTNQIDELDSSERRVNKNRINNNNVTIAAGAAESKKKKIPKRMLMASDGKWYPEKKLDTDLQLVVNYFFKLKDWDYKDKKLQATYRRYLRPAKELLKIFDDAESTIRAIDTVFSWAKKNNLEWGLDTVIKKLPEIDKLGQKKAGVVVCRNGDEAICINGRWVMAKDHSVVMDLKYFPELAKL